MSFSLSAEQFARVPAAISGGRAFLVAAGYPLGLALVDHLSTGASADTVVDALTAFQNSDGGFGRGLEVDIQAPASNPFATRLAMTVLLALPAAAAPQMKTSLQSWLVANQAADGDWHLSPETRSGDLAPWFRGWEHPSLNPACCVAGLANRLGVATPEMLALTADLFSRKASIEQVATGGFYDLLPYVEYVTCGVDVPDRDRYLDAIAASIAERSDEIFSDASHFWDSVLAAGPALMRRLPGNVLSRQVDALLDEQEDDGGWPTPYDPAWRAWGTAGNCLALSRLSALS